MQTVSKESFSFTGFGYFTNIQSRQGSGDVNATIQDQIFVGRVLLWEIAEPKEPTAKVREEVDVEVGVGALVELGLHIELGLGALSGSGPLVVDSEVGIEEIEGEARGAVGSVHDLHLCRLGQHLQTGKSGESQPAYLLVDVGLRIGAILLLGGDDMDVGVHGARTVAVEGVFECSLVEGLLQGSWWVRCPAAGDFGSRSAGHGRGGQCERCELHGE